MNAFSHRVADRTVHTGAARQGAEAPARAKPEAPARVKPGISGKTASSTPLAPAAAKRLPNLSPGEVAHAAELALHAVAAAQDDLAALDAAKIPKDPDARQRVRETKERELDILWQSAITTATTSCNIQMSSFGLAAGKLHIAENETEIVWKKYIDAWGRSLVAEDRPSI